MKKTLIVVSLVWLLTGCSSTEEFTKTCTQSQDMPELKVTEKKAVTFNNHDEVTSVVVTRTYKAKDSSGLSAIKEIKQSAENYNNNLAQSQHLKIAVITDDEDKYVLKYYLDVPFMNEEELSIFNVQKNSVKFFNKMRTENIDCE